MSRKSERNSLYRDLVGLGLPELPSGYYYLFDTEKSSTSELQEGMLYAKIYRKRFLQSDELLTYDVLVDETLGEYKSHQHVKWTFEDMVTIGTIANEEFEKTLAHTAQISNYLGKKLP